MSSNDFRIKPRVWTEYGKHDVAVVLDCWRHRVVLPPGYYGTEYLRNGKCYITGHEYDHKVIDRLSFQDVQDKEFLREYLREICRPLLDEWENANLFVRV